MSCDLNPYATEGAIVEGQQFVGRTKQLRRLAERSLALNPASTAITGLPKIGKSSLAWRLLFDSATECPQHILPVWLNVATFADLPDMLRGLALGVADTLTSKDLPQPSALAAAVSLSDVPGIRRATQRYLQDIRRSGRRIVVVLDEFDAARGVFGDNSAAAFRILRDLGYDVRWRLAWITVSRRAIRSIVAQSGATDSPFPNIFQHVELSTFSADELRQLAERSGRLDPEVLVSVVEQLTGGHPYLATLVLHEAHELRNGTVDIEQESLARSAGPEMIEYYDSLIALLREEEGFHALMEVLFGPVRTVTPHDADRLARQGLLIRKATGEYAAFSEHFNDYLQLVSRGVDLWPLWTRTERALREAIRQGLEEKFGSSWGIELPLKAPRLASAAQRWQRMREKEERAFGSLASHDLLDFTQPMDLFQIASQFWDVFKVRLGGRSRSYWDERFQVLARVRTPIAHSRLVDDALVLRAQQYCEELVEILESEASQL